MADGEKVEEEVVPSLRRRLLDLTLANENNATIWLGVDRPPTDNDYKEDALPNKGKPYSGTIDLTTGRNSRNPNYDTDKSRIYVSSKTKGDTNFGLTEEGFLVEGDTILEENEEGQAYIVAKSDSIRIIAREDVRIQNQNSNASITMKSNGDIIIHTPEQIKIGSEENADEPLVLGSEFLDFSTRVLEELATLQESINKHKHPTSHGPSGPPFNVSDFLKHKNKFDHLNDSPIGDEKIVSDFVFTQKESN